MLVVIAIIAILAGMLSPSLTKALDAARGLKCLNNLKQFAVADQIYAGENNGDVVPCFSITPGYATVDLWTFNKAYKDILGVSYNPAYQTQEVAPDILCPNATAAINYESPRQWKPLNYSYGRNYHFKISWQPGVWGTKLAHVRNAGSKIMMLDCNDWMASYGRADAVNNYFTCGEDVSGSFNAMPCYRHQKKLNANFYDGHARANIDYTVIFDPDHSGFSEANIKESDIIRKYWSLVPGLQ